MSQLEELNKKLYGDSYRSIRNFDIYVTSVCGFHCDDCLAGDIRNQGEYHADKEDIIGILDKLRGVNSVHIAGWGEPFSYPNIFEIMNYAGEIVKNEVRVNTNASHIPIEPDEAEKFIYALPSNTHVYISVDDYHEKNDPKIMQKIKMFKRYCGERDIPLTFNIRIFNKEEESGDILDRYNLRRRITIVNRVLRQGWGRNIEEARYIDLNKLLNNIRNLRTPGILPDGTVVADFVAAYLPEEYRPRISVIGNINEETLLSMFERYEEWKNRKSRWKHRNKMFKNDDMASLMGDFGTYPFCIDNWKQYSWKSKPLRGILTNINSNTAKIFADDGMNFFLKPTDNIVSDKGGVHFGQRKLSEKTDGFMWEYWKRLYGDEFTKEDRETVLQFQRLWKLGEERYGNSFWKTMLEMKGYEIDPNNINLFKQFVKAIADTDKKRKIVSYLNSQKNMLSENKKRNWLIKKLGILPKYAMWSYNFGKSEKRDHVSFTVTKELEYEGPYSVRGDSIGNIGGSLLTGLSGLLESCALAIPLFGLLHLTHIDVNVNPFLYVGSIAAYRGLTFLAGRKHQFKGETNL